jgi:hypothetical protein
MVLARLSIVNRKALQWATGAAELRTKAVVFPEWLPFSGVAVAKSPLHHECVNERNGLISTVGLAYARFAASANDASINEATLVQGTLGFRIIARSLGAQQTVKCEKQRYHDGHTTQPERA